MPDLVAARLADLGAVALDFTLRARPRKARHIDHIVGRLLAAPPLGVDAGIDHQPRRAEQEGLEVTGALKRRRVGTSSSASCSA